MSTPRTARARTAALGTVSLAAVTSAVLVVVTAGSAQAAATAVDLGTASSFGVLAGAGITNTGTTTVAGDLGTFPTTSYTGGASLTQTGVNHGGDAVTQGAKADLGSAYLVAAGEGPAAPITTDLGGQTLTAGVYGSASSLGLTGALTLDGQGSADAVFVLKAGTTLTTATASTVLLVNGAQACHVFWQIGSSATLGTGAHLAGTVLAQTDITLTTKATVDGRVLALNGAVTLDTNTITRSACLAAPPVVVPPVVVPPVLPPVVVPPVVPPVVVPPVVATTAPPASASPSPTTSPAATPAATPSASARPTATPTSTPTATPAATPAPTSTPGATGTPVPIAVPTVGGDGAPVLSGSGGPLVPLSPRTPGHVSAVPVGGVQAGDGSTSPAVTASDGDRGLALQVTAAAAVACLAARRLRRRA